MSSLLSNIASLGRALNAANAAQGRPPVPLPVPRLLPCLCGNGVLDIVSSSLGKRRVRCPRCGERGAPDLPTDYEAAAQWNAGGRTDPRSAPEISPCVCGAAGMDVVPFITPYEEHPGPFGNTTCGEQIRCKKCGAHGPVCGWMNAAIALWNRLVEEELLSR
jgi:hypothetical protein